MTQAAAMSSVLAQIEREGATVLPDGRRVTVHSAVDPESGRVLRAAIEACRPRLGCEVGLAFGVSSLHILDAMSPFGGKLIGMDPAQHDGTWQGAGLYNIERAGFASRYRFHEASSQRVLPRLEAEGTRIQFGFIDGWHTFDHALVDFFYIDLMMDVGGIVVLDDVGYPALRRLAHFIVTNRSYELVDAARLPSRTGWKTRAKRAAQAAFRPLLRDDTTPSAHSRELETALEGTQLVALRKLAHDGRRFDHFRPF